MLHDTTDERRAAPAPAPGGIVGGLMSRVTQRAAVSSALSDRWQSTAQIAAATGLTMHRAGELLRQLYERELVDRRQIASPRAVTFEYRRRVRATGSGVIAGRVLYRGLASWPGPRSI